MNESLSSVRQRSRWHDPMLWLLGGIVVMVVGTNAVMIWVAVNTHPDLVRRDYYEASKQVDAQKAELGASVKLGWVVGVAAAASAGAIEFQVTERSGAPVVGLEGSVTAYRPADAALDQRLVLSEIVDRPGIYRADFVTPAPGLWRLRIDVRRETERFVKEVPFVTGTVAP